MPTRTCPGCQNSYEINADNFYITPSTGRPERCRPCHNAYYREYRRARRAGLRGRVMASAAATSTGRRFGVEIEFITTRGGNYYSGAQLEYVAEALRNAGLTAEVQRYNHTVSHSIWKVTTDASVRRGGELVSPVLQGEEGRHQLKIALQVLRDVGCKTSSSCGVHVHHEIADYNFNDISRLATVWDLNANTISSMVSRSRRNGQWCQDLNEYDMRILRTLSDHNRDRGHSATVSRMGLLNRYKSINFAAYPKYGTVEIRQHQGTLNTQKILAWIDFGQAIIDTVKTEQIDPTFESLNQLLEYINLPTQTVSYLLRRAASFRPA